MGKTDKLLAKARSSPQNISFQELESLADAYGLPLKPPRAGGSHYILRLPDGTKYTIPREGSEVKQWYVRRVVEAIEILGRQNEKEDDSGEREAGD